MLVEPVLFLYQLAALASVLDLHYLAVSPCLLHLVDLLFEFVFPHFTDLGSLGCLLVNLSLGLGQNALGEIFLELSLRQAVLRALSDLLVQICSEKGLVRELDLRKLELSLMF